MEENDKEEEKETRERGRETATGEGGGGEVMSSMHPIFSFAVYFVCLCPLAPLALERAALRITPHVRCISMNCKGD